MGSQGTTIQSKSDTVGNQDAGRNVYDGSVDVLGVTAASSDGN